MVKKLKRLITDAFDFFNGRITTLRVRRVEFIEDSIHIYPDPKKPFKGASAHMDKIIFNVTLLEDFLILCGGIKSRELNDTSKMIIIWLVAHEMSHVGQKTWEDDNFEYANEMHTVEFLQEHAEEIRKHFGIDSDISQVKHMSGYIERNEGNSFIYDTYSSYYEKIYEILERLAGLNIKSIGKAVIVNLMKGNKVEESFVLDVEDMSNGITEHMEYGAMKGMAILSDKIFIGYNVLVDVYIDTRETVILVECRLDKTRVNYLDRNEFTYRDFPYEKDGIYSYESYMKKFKRS